jgi:hypothetical protein
MIDDRHRLASERQRGAEEGEAFDRRLRERERVEREERLSRIAWVAAAPAWLPSAGAGGEPDGRDLVSPAAVVRAGAGAGARAASPAGTAGGRRAAAAEDSPAPGEDQAGGEARHRPGRRPLETLQLEREVERLNQFYNAVQNSRVWRVTQRLRRLVGRAW